jgi:hypothetical protein
MQRAVGLTEGDAALRAAGGLFRRLGVDELGVDLVEIARASVRRPLLRLLARHGDKFQHPLGHGGPSCLELRNERHIGVNYAPVNPMVL